MNPNKEASNQNISEVSSTATACVCLNINYILQRNPAFRRGNTRLVLYTYQIAAARIILI